MPEDHSGAAGRTRPRKVIAGHLCFHQLQVKHWDAALNGWDSYMDVVVFRSLGAVRVDGGGGGVSGGAGGA